MHFMHAYNLLLCVSSLFYLLPFFPSVYLLLFTVIFLAGRVSGVLLLLSFSVTGFFFLAWAWVSGQAGFGGNWGFFLWYGYYLG